jgi:hypothetical protein
MKVIWALILVAGAKVPSDVVENCDNEECEDAVFVQTGSVERRSQEWMVRMEEKMLQTGQTIADQAREQMSQMAETIANQAMRIKQLESNQVAKCDFCDMVKSCDASSTVPPGPTPAPPSVENRTCEKSVEFDMTLELLTENTLGHRDGRLLFSHTVDIDGVSIDLSVTDASKLPEYHGEYSVFKKDARKYTGSFMGAGRIAIDDPGEYMFRFTFTETESGAPAKLPLFPVTFYDNDGGSEQISACNVEATILDPETNLEEIKSWKLDEETGKTTRCYTYKSPSKEVNLPSDWDDLSGNQRKVAVSYLYKDTGVFDIGLTIEDGENSEDRYFVFKSSKAFACALASDVANPLVGHDLQTWKPHEKKADA